MKTLELLRKTMELSAVKGLPATDLEKQQTERVLNDLEKYLAELEFKELIKRLRRTQQKLCEGLNDATRIADLLEALQEAIEDEGEDRTIVNVPARKSEMIYADPNPWDALGARFPEVGADVLSALKCHAIGEDTACVFHTMRVLEVGLGALASDVGRTFDVQQWHNIIEEIESEIRKLRETLPRGEAKNRRLAFLSQAAKEFFYFKDGWRNYVSHNRGTYDEHQALSVLEHVRTFMTLLAQNLE